MHGADFANLGDTFVETVSTVGRPQRVGECMIRLCAWCSVV